MSDPNSSSQKKARKQLNIQQVFNTFQSDNIILFKSIYSKNSEIVYISDTKLGDNIMHIVVRYKAFQILYFLLQTIENLKKYAKPNHDGNSFLHLMVLKPKYSEQFIYMVNNYFNITQLSMFNYSNKNGQDLLNLAVTKGQISVIIALTEKGITEFTRDSHGNTPLTNALLNHQDSITKYLIEFGFELFDDEYSMNLVFSEDDTDLFDLALNVYSEKHDLKNNLPKLEELYIKLKDISSYSNSRHCAQVLEDFYKNFKTVKYISNKSNKTVNISELNEQTCELTLTKKLENYISIKQEIKKDNLDYSQYKENMKHASLYDKGYNNIRDNLNCKKLNPDKFTHLQEIYDNINSVIFRAQYYYNSVIIKLSKDEDKESSKKLLIELNFMSMINHPNVISIYGYFEIENKFAIVYQDISEGSLYDWIHEREHKFSFTEKLFILTQIAKTLYCLHDCYNVIHRDIKSSNILLDANLHVYICDLGMSKTIDLKNAYVTHNDQHEELQYFQTVNHKTNSDIVCTINYMAPEYLDKRITHRKLDTYAFGILLWEVLSERTPWEGMADFQIVYQVMRGNRPDIQEVRNCYDNYLIVDKLISILQNCWNQEYKERKDMDWVYLELQDIYENVKM